MAVFSSRGIMHLHRCKSTGTQKYDACKENDARTKQEYTSKGNPQVCLLWQTERKGYVRWR